MTLATDQPTMRRRPGRPSKLRTPENATRICQLVGDGKTLRQVAQVIGCTAPAIAIWIHDDEVSNSGAMIAKQYARAKELCFELMAEETLSIADDRSFVGQPDANALVTQQRLAVDTRKWLLSKMLPRKYGDRVEISGDPSAPIVTRIELVAVEPPSRTRVIDNASDIDEDPQKA